MPWFHESTVAAGSEVCRNAGTPEHVDKACLVLCLRPGDLGRDKLLLHEREEAVVHGDHTQFLGCLHRGGPLKGFPLSYTICGSLVDQENFKSGHPPPSSLLAKRLGDNPFQDFRAFLVGAGEFDGILDGDITFSPLLLETPGNTLSLLDVPLRERKEGEPCVPPPR